MDDYDRRANLIRGFMTSMATPLDESIRVRVEEFLAHGELELAFRTLVGEMPTSILEPTTETGNTLDALARELGVERTLEEIWSRARP